MKVFNKSTWKRHANPWSGWTRVCAFFLFPIPFWFQSWTGLGLLLLFFVINPLIFNEPKSTNNWMSKSIQGEEIWTKNGLFQKDFPTLLNVLNGLFFFLMIYSSYNRMLGDTILSVVLSSVFKLWYLDRMVVIANEANLSNNKY